MKLYGHTKLKYEECYAKIVLEYCFPQKYGNLLIEDKPDLYDKANDIGIEVTTAVNHDLQEARSLWSKMASKRPVQQEKDKGRMHQLHYDYQGGVQNWGTTEYDKGADSQAFDIVYKAIEYKLQKLNQAGLYKYCRRYALFIESELAMEKEWLDAFARKINNISFEYSKIYGAIYFVAQNDIVEVDIIGNKCSEIISFDESQYKLATLAYEMVKDGENDQT